jgi:hypothetical protein
MAHFKFTQIRRFMNVRGLAVLGTLVGLTALGGCKLDDAVGPSNSQAIIQFINAAPRYSAVDLFVDSTSAIGGEAYGQGSSIYVNALATARHFTVRSTGDTTVLATKDLIAANQTVYSFILTQHTTGAGLIVLPDTVSVPPDNKAGLRFVNASPAAGLVDVYATDTDSSLANATPIATDVAYEDVTNYQFVTPSPNLRVRLTTPNTHDVVLDIPEVSTIVPGQVNTIVVIDATSGELPLTWLAIPDR